MKVSRIAVGIVGGAVLTTGAIVFSSWNWSLRSEAAIRLSRAMILESHSQTLRAEVAAVTLQLSNLMGSLQIASNRIVEVERLLEAEKKTHDPIRNQIEAMLVEQINLKDNLGKRDMSLSGLNTSLNEARKANKELLTQTRERADQIAQLEKDVKSVREHEAAVQTQLEEARNKAVALQVKLEETQKRLTDSERLAGELQKQKQALESVAATNTAPSASAP